MKLGYKHTKEVKEKMRKAHLGKKYKKMSDIGRENIRKAHLGFKLTSETKKKLSDVKKGNSTITDKGRKKLRDIHLGKNNHQWKGGVTPLYEQIRKSKEYKLWRIAVFERDKYTCIWCGERGGKLHADHIKPFALYPKLRLAIDNGRTLCVSCHKTTDTYGVNIKK